MTTQNSKKLQLDTTKVPAFPFAPVQYEQRHQDQFHRILTQYLNQTGNITSELVAPSGGRFVSFPHLAASDPADQYATANNTAKLVTWGTTPDSYLGFTLNAGPTPPANTATAKYTGIYKIDYSLQFANTDNAAHDVFVWLEINGNNFAASASKFTVPARKTPTDHGYLVAYSSLTFPMTAGDYVGLYWATGRAYIPSPLQDGVYMEAYPAQTVGSASIPSIPSSVGTIAFVSAITT